MRTHLSTADAGRLAHETGTLTTSSAFAAILTPSGWGQLSEYRRVAFTTRGILPAPEEPWMPEGQSRFYTMRPEGDRNLCLTTGTGIILGATLAIENCVPRSLQAFDLVPSTSDGHRLVALRSLYNTRLMVTVGAGGKLTLESGGSIAVNPRAQQWWVQNRPGGMMQFVSALDGRCLVVPPVKTSEALTTGPCESSPVSVEPRRMPMAWQGSGSTVRFELGFHPVSKTYILQSRKAGQTAWVDRKRISLADRTLEWSMGLLDTGDYDLRIVDHTGLLVYEGLSISRPSGQDVRPVTGFG